jgi:hypothetical protein
MIGSRAFCQSTSATLCAGGGAEVVVEGLADGLAEVVVDEGVGVIVADGVVVADALSVAAVAAVVVTDDVTGCAPRDVDDDVQAASATVARPAASRDGVRRIGVIWVPSGVGELRRPVCPPRAAEVAHPA